MLKVKTRNTNNSFSRLGAKLWNKIPGYLTHLPKKAFKRVLRKFDILEMKDDFIEIHPND